MDDVKHWTSERSELAKAYPGLKWRQKVLEMSDAQVHAAYVSVLQRREKSAQIRAQKCANSGKTELGETATDEKRA